MKYKNNKSNINQIQLNQTCTKSNRNRMEINQKYIY